MGQWPLRILANDDAASTDSQNSLNKALKLAPTLPQFKGVSEDETNRIATLVWTATYNSCVNGATDFENIVFDPSVFAIGAMSTNSRCPSDPDELRAVPSAQASTTNA